MPRPRDPNSLRSKMDALRAERKQVEEEKAAEAVAPLPNAKEVYLVSLAQVGTVAKAAKLAHVTRKDVMTWERDDPQFVADAQMAHMDFIDRIEERMIDMGADKSHRQQFMALVTVLNAFHPAFGRVRFEMLERALSNFLKNLAKAVQQHAAPDVAQAIMADVDDLANQFSVSSFFAGKGG